jgi:Undecaprenyl-phosphate glucose phosphotransferase
LIRQSQNFLTQVYALFDFVFVILVFLFSWWIKFESGWMEYESHLGIQHYFYWSIVYAMLSIAVGYVLGYYTPKRKRTFSFELFKIMQVHTLSFLLLLSMLFIFKQVDISRAFLGLFLVCNLILAGVYRFFVKQSLQRLRQRGYNKQFILIVGAGSLGRSFYKNLMQHPELGFEVVGFLDDNLTEHEYQYRNYKSILGALDDLAAILQKATIDEVIIALPLHAHDKLEHIIRACEKDGVKVLIIPDYYDYLPAKPFFDNFAGIPMINVRDIPLDELRNRILKRTFDIVFASIAILITSPILLLTAIGIKLTSRGPIIFKQERVGFNRRMFQMYKFRSMKVMPAGESDTVWTTEQDPRTTRFGSFLRKTSLDELPQFFNVLLGHMSVVGPRPERPYFVEQFKEDIPKYMVKHHIRPGITGWAQSNGLRGDTSIEDRIKHDIYYLENWSFFLDLKIIVKTMKNGFVNENAY